MNDPEKDAASSPPDPKSDQKPEPEEDFAALFAASERGAASERIAVGDRVSGKVIAIDAVTVFVAVGAKGEATLDASELRDPATGELTVAVGDPIEATVVDDGASSGSAVLRRVLGRGGSIPAELEQAAAHGIPIEGLVSAEVKGGFEVQIAGTRAFCPGSQIDLRRGGERIPSSEYIGRRYSFRITKLDERARNVVVSRRDLLEEEAAAKAEATWAQIRVGAVLTGKVSSVRDFGAFVDLGEVEGMIHVSELAYRRVAHPSEVLEVGQAVEVQVTKVAETVDSRGRRQVGLSLKALATDPWTTAPECYPAGATVGGVVRRLESYGAFVELEPGLEGLVHISKIAGDRRLAHARQALAEGQEVQVTVLGVDPEKRRVSLSMVEQSKAAEEAAAQSERRDEQRVIAELNRPKSLGTFADLLADARREKK